jgi:hypothetical protein
MNILKILHPESKEVDLDGEIWNFSYRVWDLIEFEKTIIVHFKIMKKSSHNRLEMLLIKVLKLRALLRMKCLKQLIVADLQMSF